MGHATLSLQQHRHGERRQPLHDRADDPVLAPDSFCDTEIVVTPPSSNTSPIKLYFVVDTYLDGGDAGAAFIQQSNGSTTTIGVTRAGQYETFTAVNRPFDR